MSLDLTKPGTLGVFVHHAATTTDELHAICALGFDYICLKVSDGARQYEPAALASAIHAANAITLPVVAWDYVYPGDASEAGIAALAGALPAGVEHLILDADSEWETAGASEAANSLCHGIAEATEHKIALHLSSFYATAEHRAFPWRDFLSHCASFMPQSYMEGITSASKVIGRTRLQAAALARICKVEMVPTVNAPALLGLLPAMGAPAANVWLWDGDGQDQGVRGREAAWKPAIDAFKRASAG